MQRASTCVLCWRTGSIVLLLIAIGIVLLIGISIVGLLTSLISLLIPVIPPVLLPVTGRCLCMPTCPNSRHMRIVAQDTAEVGDTLSSSALHIASSGAMSFG